MKIGVKWIDNPLDAFNVGLDDGSSILTSLSNEGRLTIAMETETQQAGVGRALMESAFGHFGGKVKSVDGVWQTAMPSNPNSFNANIRNGMTSEQAAPGHSPGSSPRSTASPGPRSGTPCRRTP
jgi:hypothetical protein